MTTEQRVKALAKKLGAKIEGVPSAFGVEAEAPDGYSWACDPGTHVLVSAIWDDDTPEDVWKDLLERMEMGLSKCPDTCDCKS